MDWLAVSGSTTYSLRSGCKVTQSAVTTKTNAATVKMADRLSQSRALALS